jgi:hypothetical protein
MTAKKQGYPKEVTEPKKDEVEQTEDDLKPDNDIEFEEDDVEHEGEVDTDDEPE